MYSIVTLANEKSFVNLTFHSRLPITKDTKPFKKDIYYLFFYKNQIHGIYQFTAQNDKYFFFIKNNFKPITYISSKQEIPLEEYKKVLAIFKKENQIEIKCFFQMKEEKENYNFSFCSDAFKHLFFHFSIKKTKKLFLLSKKLNTVLENDLHQKNLSELKKWGSELYQLIFKGDLQIFSQKITSYVISNRSNLPIQFCFDGNKFLFIENKSIHHKPLKNQKTDSSLNNFLILSSMEDAALQQETNVILKTLKENKIKYQFELIDSNSLLKIDNQDFVYLGCHGKMVKDNFYLVNEKNKLPFFALFEIHPPKVLFLNSCYSCNTKVKNWFFSKGGQTLIVGEGKINCQENANLLKSFFWQICYKKESVHEAFYSLQKKSLFENLNSFRLKIYGHGKEKFV